MIKRICNECCNELNTVEEKENFSIHRKIGYASRKYDGEEFNLDLCGACMDGCIDYFVQTCKINPVSGSDYYDKLIEAYSEGEE